MVEEIKAQKEQQSNTVALIGMICSIIGLILLLTVFGSIFGLFLLVLGFILGIIGLFYKPRTKARVAILIPLIVFIAITYVVSYVWKSIKAPAIEFVEWVEPQFEQLQNNENFDGERFGDILEAELNSMTNGKSENEWKELFESSTGSNSIEKGAYMFSSMFKEGFESALEKYNNELPEIENEDINVDEEIIEEAETIEDNEGEENNEIIEETGDIEVSDESEEGNIEQILDSLE